MTDTKYPHVLQLALQPWAILPATLAVIRDMLALRLAGETFTSDEIQARIGAGPSTQPPSRAGAVAVIPIYGVISPRANLMSEMSGGTSLDIFTASLNRALDDPEVSSILLDIDSPGGLTSGVPEAAAAVRAARAEKPVVALANTMAGSAAYYLAAQASEIVASPSASVGGIGVYGIHEDISGMNEKLGVQTTLISAGKYKTEGNPFEPLSDEARGAMQEQADDMYAMFVRDVAHGRNVPLADVKDGYGQGRMLSAEKAVEAGLADRVGTFDGTVSRMMTAGGRKALSATATWPSRTVTTTPGWMNTTTGAFTPEMTTAATYTPEPYQAEPDETVECPECGAMNEADAAFCDQCGAELPAPTEEYAVEADESIVCPECESMNEPDAVYCDQCGTKLAGRDDVTVVDGTEEPAGSAAAATLTPPMRAGWHHLLEHDGFRRVIAGSDRA